MLCAKVGKMPRYISNGVLSYQNIINKSKKSMREGKLYLIWYKHFKSNFWLLCQYSIFWGIIHYNVETISDV